MKYLIEVSGCDDTTRIVADLTVKQAEAVGRVAEQITAASTYGCMPVMSIRKATPQDIKDTAEENPDE